VNGTRASRVWSLAFVVTGALALTSLARATPQYPGALDDELATDCPDPLSRCLICHTTAAGGKTAFQPFALTLRANNFYRPNDPNGLRATLRLLALPANNPDSDEDGVTDIDELRQCRNPSGGEFDSVPEYGCDGARVAPPSDRWGAAAALLLGAILGGGVARRARAARRPRRG
jgi:hypothetical protein